MDSSQKLHKQAQVETILSKLTGESDVDWIEMASLDMFDVSPDHLRKMASGIKLVYDAGMLAMPTDEDVEVEDESDPIFDKVKREKLQMWDLRREVNEKLRFEARDALLRESVIKAAQMLKPYAPVAKHTFVHGENTLIATVSDAHFGKMFTVRGLRGEVLNEYSPEIFAKRMEVLKSKILEKQKEHKAQEIYIFGLGDAIDGMLRMKQLMELRYGMVDSTMMYAEFMAGWLHDLSVQARCAVKAFLIGGNHDTIRPLGSKRPSDFPNESMAKIIGWFVAERLKNNKNITVVHGNNIELVNIYDRNILLVHGDNEKASDALAKEYSYLYGVSIDMVYRGHLHTLSITTAGVNQHGEDILEIKAPSICGVDVFAMEIKKRSAAGSVITILSETDDPQFIAVRLGE